MAHRRPKQPTLADVAAASGVSIASASYALADRRDVKLAESTRLRIAAAAKELGYRRNGLAVDLRRGRTDAIAVVAPSASGHTTGREPAELRELLFAVATIVSERGRYPVLHLGGDEAAALRALGERRFDACLLVDLAPDSKWTEACNEVKLPYVELGFGHGMCQVHADDARAMRLAIEHLAGLGHTSIGHVANKFPGALAEERMRSFLNAVHEAGLRMDATPIVHSNDALAALLQGPGRPTALVLASSAQGPSVYRAARRAGLSLPDHLSLVGFGETAAADLDPALTTVGSPVGAFALAAAELLEAQLSGGAATLETVIPASLTVRGSTALTSRS